MKKIVSLILCAVLLIGMLCACSNDTASKTEEVKVEGTLEEILAKIYEGQTSEFFQQVGLMTMPLDAESSEYFIGVPFDNVTEAIASEPMNSSLAYSVCLVRVAEGTDIEQFKADVKAGVDPRKWLCVGVEEENVIVDNIGDLVILIMSDSEGEAVHTAFKALAE